MQTAIIYLFFFAFLYFSPNLIYKLRKTDIEETKKRERLEEIKKDPTIVLTERINVLSEDLEKVNSEIKEMKKIYREASKSEDPNFEDKEIISSTSLILEKLEQIQQQLKDNIDDLEEKRSSIQTKLDVINAQKHVIETLSSLSINTENQETQMSDAIEIDLDGLVEEVEKELYKSSALMELTYENGSRADKLEKKYKKNKEQVPVQEGQ